MYKISMFLLALCLCLGAIAYAEPGSTYDPNDRSQQGDQPSQQGDTKTNMGMTNVQVAGTIQKIDLEKKMIMIREDKTDKVERYKFTDSTAFSNQNSKATASSFNAGDHVVMQVESQGNRVLQIDKDKNH